jgi:adenylate cyclase
MSPSTVLGAVVFTDLVGFTEYNDARGDDAAVEVLDQVRSLAETVTSSTDGRIVKELGDGLMLWFGCAADAATATVELVARLEELRSCDAFPLALRVGVHHGESRRRGDDVVGQTVNIAARIVDLAGPMEIVVSEAFVVACGPPAGDTTFVPIGPTTVRGVTDPLWLYRVSDPATNFGGLRARS